MLVNQKNLRLVGRQIRNEVHQGRQARRDMLKAENAIIIEVERSIVRMHFCTARGMACALYALELIEYRTFNRIFERLAYYERGEG